MFFHIGKARFGRFGFHHNSINSEYGCGEGHRKDHHGCGAHPFAEGYVREFQHVNKINIIKSLWFSISQLNYEMAMLIKRYPSNAFRIRSFSVN